MESDNKFSSADNVSEDEINSAITYARDKPLNITGASDTDNGYGNKRLPRFESMELNTKNAILTYYFGVSVVIILINLFFTYGPMWHRDITVLSQQEIPLQPLEYFGKFFSYIMPGAIYGLFALIPLIRLRMGLVVKEGFFTGAIAVGSVFVFALMVDSRIDFSRIDCASSCVAYIPSHFSTVAMEFGALLFTFVTPIIVRRMFKLLSQDL